MREKRRNRGIGGRLRLSGRDTIVIYVTEDAEAAGAARFYQQFGWQPLAREI